MLINVPLLKIADEYEEEGFQIIGDFHDLFILGEDGGLHYLNIQGMVGTRYQELKFKTQYSDIWGEELFEKVNFLGLMDLDAKRFKADKDPRYLEIRKAIENYFKELEEAANKEEAEMLEELIGEIEERKGKENG